MNTHFNIPERVRILNNSTRYPITFRDNANVVVAPTAATKVLIEGMGIFNLPNIVSAKLSRGFNPSFQKWSITAAAPAQITVVAPPSPARVWIDIQLESTGRDFATARNDYQFGVTIRKELTFLPGETTNTAIAKLYNALFLNTSAGFANKNYLLKSGSGTAMTFVNGKATTGTVLEIETADRNYFIKSFTVTNDEGMPSTYLTVFNPVQVTPFNRGINYGSDIEFKEKMQVGNNSPYGFDIQEIPLEKSIYTMVEFTYRVISDNQDSGINPNRGNKLFLLESACEATIDNLADFFNQLPAANKSFDAIVAGVYTYNVNATQFKTNA